MYSDAGGNPAPLDNYRDRNEDLSAAMKKTRLPWKACISMTNGIVDPAESGLKDHPARIRAQRTSSQRSLISAPWTFSEAMTERWVYSINWSRSSEAD